MAETFKKGQMVPKRLKLALTHRKVQHRITFGCDVVVDGRVIKPVRPDDGPIFTLPHRVARRWNNGTWQKFSITFGNVFIVGAGVVVFIVGAGVVVFIVGAGVDGVYQGV